MSVNINSNKRETLKREILAYKDKTFAARIFNSTDRIIRIITRRRQPVSWIYSAAVLALTLLLFIGSIGWLFHESDKMRTFFWFGCIALELSLFAVILAYILEGNILRDISDHILDFIEADEDLDNLGLFMAEAWAKRIYLTFSLPFVVSLTIIISLVTSFLRIKLFGFTFVIGCAVVWYFLWVGLQHLVFRYKLTLRLGYYQYNIYIVEPARSVIINRISHLMGSQMYLIAFYLAVDTSLIAFLTEFAWAVPFFIILGWMPLVTQFFGSQFSLNKIIKDSKLKTLNKIQTQINKLQEGDLTKKEKIEAITCLMEYHNRIMNTPNHTLNLRVGFGFFNQLMIPLLGYLLANMDKFIGLFR